MILHQGESYLSHSSHHRNPFYLFSLYKKSQALRHNTIDLQLSQQTTPCGFNSKSYISIVVVTAPHTEFIDTKVLICKVLPLSGLIPNTFFLVATQSNEYRIGQMV